MNTYSHISEAQSRGAADRMGNGAADRMGNLFQFPPKNPLAATLAADDLAAVSEQWGDGRKTRLN